jgi:hypothetical protein
MQQNGGHNTLLYRTPLRQNISRFCKNYKRTDQLKNNRETQKEIRNSNKGSSQ